MKRKGLLIAALLATTGCATWKAGSVRWPAPMSRELDGDRPGAIADLRAALEVEQDPGRRTAITGLLHYLGSGR